MHLANQRDRQNVCYMNPFFLSCHPICYLRDCITMLVLVTWHLFAIYCHWPMSPVVTSRLRKMKYNNNNLKRGWLACVWSQIPNAWIVKKNAHLTEDTRQHAKFRGCQPTRVFNHQSIHPSIRQSINLFLSLFRATPGICCVFQLNRAVVWDTLSSISSVWKEGWDCKEE